jgi:hypothetical protein
LVGKIFRRNREVGFYVLYGEKRLSRSHGPDQRYIDKLAANGIKTFVYDLDRARLGRILADISVLFQSFQMGVDGRSRFEVDRFTDITDCRRIASVNDLTLDIVKNLLLLGADASVSHKIPPAQTQQLLMILT